MREGWNSRVCATRAEAYLAEDDLSAEMVEDMVKEVRVFNAERIEVELNHTDLVGRYAVGEDDKQISRGDGRS